MFNNSDKSLLNACFYIPLAMFHGADGSISGVRFWVFGNIKARTKINYNLLSEPPKVDAISGFTFDITLDDLKKSHKTYGVSRGTGGDRGLYFLEGINDIAHIRADGTSYNDVVQVVPKRAEGTDVVSLINWKGFVRRTTWSRALIEVKTGILAGIGNATRDRICLRGNTRYAPNSDETLRHDLINLDMRRELGTLVIQDMPNLVNLMLPAVSSGIYVNLPWQSQTEAFKHLILPEIIRARDTAFSLRCNNYPNDELSQRDYSNMRINEIDIKQAPELTSMQLKLISQLNTSVCNRLTKGYYDPGICSCELRCAPKLRTIELLPSTQDSAQEFTCAARLRLGGTLSLDAIKIHRYVGVLELVLDDMYLPLSNTIHVTGGGCGTLILDASYLMKCRTTTIDVDTECDLVIIRTTPKKSCGEGERLHNAVVSVGDPERILEVNCRKDKTKIFVDKECDCQ